MAGAKMGNAQQITEARCLFRCGADSLCDRSWSRARDI